MLTRIYLRTFDLTSIELPQVEKEWCIRHNFNAGLKIDGYDSRGDNGAICSMLKSMITERVGTVILAHNGARYVGWGIIYGESETYHPYKTINKFQCYVIPSERRKGIGTKILAKATAIHGRVEVYVHTLSEDFFKANGLTGKKQVTGRRLKKKHTRKPLAA